MNYGKRVLIVVLVLMFSVSFLFASGKQETKKAGTEGFSWKKFEGETIRFLALKFYYTNIIKEKLPEFEALTGMKVKLEDYPED